MRIKVRFFAMMAQQAGVREFESAVREGATVAEAVEVIRSRFPRLQWPTGTIVAVNQEYVSIAKNDGDGARQTLREGDEVAIIPPVSGG